MNRRIIALVLAGLMILSILAGCGETKEPAKEEPKADPVTLTVAGGWPDCKALEEIGRKFTEENQNVTIQYEYLQDYYPSVVKRMSGDDQVDLFFTTNIQSESELLPYVADLHACEGLDLSHTFEGLIENFEFREENAEQKKLYAIPLGAEMRGMYVNKTLLDSLNIKVPTDQKSLLDACAALKEKGYIPFQGNPGSFGQTLLYPWVCNLIANADDPKAVYAEIEAHQPGMSKLFEEPISFMYTLIEKGYYDYKKSQTELNLFNDTTDEDYARYFLSIQQNGETWEKADDVGQVAFMPAAMSLKRTIDKTKDDYHSNIEYVFVPAPVGEDGGYVYLSPAHGIAMNKDSKNLEWSIKFLNFLFEKENNEAFTKTFDVMPNNKDAFSYISTLYDIEDDHISHVGEVTFTYDFYKMMVESLTEVSKANNPKYMKTEDDGSASLYPLSYYMEKLEERVAAQ